MAGQTHGDAGLLPRATAASLARVRHNAPLALREIAIWVVADRSAKTMADGSRKSSKAPINPRTGEFARSNDASTWGTFDDACRRALDDDRAFGVGVNLRGGDYVGLDLDHVVDLETGRLQCDAAALLDALPPSYAEVSPSGTGLRVFFRGRLPAGFVGSQVANAFGDGTALECYDGGRGARYLTVTGDVFDGRTVLANVTEAELDPLVALQDRVRERRASTNGVHRNGHAGREHADDDVARARWALVDQQLLDADLPHNEWFRVLAALKDLGDDGLSIAVDWSRRGAKFVDGEIGRRWPGITGSSIGALFGMLDDAAPGWRERHRDACGSAAGRTRRTARKGDDVEPSTSDRDCLGIRHAKTKRIVLDPNNTVPTARAYVEEFHRHPEGCTLRHHAGTLLEWADNHYREVEDQQVRARLQSWLHDAHRFRGTNKKTGLIEVDDFPANPRNVNAALDSIMAHVYLPTSTPVPSWLGDAKGMLPAHELLPCKSGSLHLPTERMIPATPALFVRNALDFDYDPEAPEPKRWLAFLDELWGDDLESIELLRNWFGYCLTGATDMQKMLLVVGPRRSGKGTIARVLTHLVGTANVCGPTTSSLAGPFGLQPLLGKTLAIVSDARFSGENVATVVERLLCITGEDALTVERKFKGAVTLRLPLRFTILTNELPRLRDSSSALAGRFMILLLSRSFFGRENARLVDELLAERTGILRWAVEGLERLRERGRFLMPTSSESAVQDLEDLGSPVAAFVRERCEVGPGHRTPCTALYAAWQAWCAADGRTAVTNRTTFGRDLAAAVPGIRRREGTGGLFFYEGVVLR